MFLDDGTAYRQPNTQTVAFGRVKRIEKLLNTLAFETHSRIPYAQTHEAVFWAFGPDQQTSRAIVNFLHCVGCVAEQVQNDLLELNPVSGHARETIRKLCLYDHLI